MNGGVAKLIRSVVYGDMAYRSRNVSRTKTGKGSIVTDERRAKYKRAKRDYMRLNQVERIAALTLMRGFINDRKKATSN